MADWKQITARIRRARTSKDPAGQLSALYEKTHDAMVAFELAKYFETSAQNADASKWYATAAERFRRADWKTKAQEAAVRLGGEGGGNAAPSGDESAISPAPLTDESDAHLRQNAAHVESVTAVESSSDEVEEGSESETDSAGGNSGPSPASSGANADDQRRRRRGRRGGRNRRKGSTAATKSPDAQPTPASTSSAPRRHTAPAPTVEETPEPETTAAMATRGTGPKGRYGDPGLSSRISLLEMQFRRLLSCPPVSLDESDHAPVGPGVFVLSDSEMTSYYYVEACQTLRIAVANLLRGNSNKRGGESTVTQLAEHLGIAESRVPKYLGEHCVVRWLQLDEGASHFAHFVISVLRPALNE